MDTADSLSCYKQVVNYFCESVSADLKSAVLIVQCRIYKDRKFSHIDVVFHVHTEHRRDPFLDRSRSADLLDHRCIEPYAASERCIHAFAACRTLADNAGCSHVTCLKRMHERLTVHIDKLCSYRTYLLCHKSTEDL